MRRPQNARRIVNKDRGNLFALPEALPPEEWFEDLLETPGFRLERIVSTGQGTTPGQWLEQARAEWVVLLSGSALLRFEEEHAPRELAPGDWLWIAGGRRHRVERTDPSGPTIWLALHHA
jgi:cupin 2 domain-containing protein